MKGKNSKNDVEGKETKKKRKSEKLKDKETKKKIKKELLSKIPTHNEDGFAYNKVQIRRMMKRVKKGLNPVPTKEEERERRKLEELENSSEEGDIIHKNSKQVLEESEEKYDDDCSERNTHKVVKEEEKIKMKKDVPSDYICQACMNKHSPPHFIYDCPDKVRRRGCNKVKKRKLDNFSTIVYVSGLPFNVRNKEVCDYFKEQCKGPVRSCKLFTFSDSNRCNGQALITFESTETASNALSLDGSVFERFNEKNEETSQKKLRLSVKKKINKS